MATNPNPIRITDATWKLCEGALATIPGCRNGGIYANKQCYHNTVAANQASWPTAYCIKIKDDLTGPLDKARAIDLTMSDAEMKKRTGYLKASAEHPDDDRLRGLREFIGTLDGKAVFCMIKDGEYAVWRHDWNRDSSHLWHIHLSILTKFCAVWADVLEAVLSVLSGEAWESWKLRKGGTQVAKIFQINEEVEGIPAAALYASGGSGFYHLIDWDEVTVYAAEWKLPILQSWPQYSEAKARKSFGPFLGDSQQLTAGPPGIDGEDGVDGEDGDDGAGLAPGDLITVTGTVTVTAVKEA